MKKSYSISNKNNIHFCCFSITIILITTTYFGFIAGFFFGVIQLTSLLFMFFCWRKIAEYLENHFKDLDSKRNKPHKK